MMSSNLRGISSFLTLTALVVTSCGGSGSESENESVASRHQQICGDLAQARCTWGASCEARWLSQLFGDVETCVEWYARTCPIWFQLRGTSITPNGIEACVNAHREAECGDPLPECETNPGFLPEHSHCSIDAQCQTNNCISLTVGDDPAPNCGSCERESKFTYGKEGESCPSSGPCEDDLYCENGICTPRRAIGEDCTLIDGQDSCETWRAQCIDGRCEEIPLVAAGEPCGARADRAVDCLGGYCDESTGESRCVGWRREGESCSQTAYCQPALTCYGGVCAPVAPTQCEGFRTCSCTCENGRTIRDIPAADCSEACESATGEPGGDGTCG